MTAKSNIQKVLILITLFALVLASCAPAATPTVAPVPNQPAPTQPAPTAAPITPPTLAPTQPPAPTATTAPAQPVTRTKLTVVSWWDFTTTTALQELKKQFEAANPDIELDFTLVGADGYYDKMLTTIAGKGDIPDVMMLAMDQLPVFADRGAVLNLDSLITPDVKADMYPVAINALTYKGSLYAMPRTVTTQVMYFNKALFTADNIPLPNDNWTWNDFRELAKKLTKVDANGQPIQWGYYFPKWNDGFYQFLRQNDGGFVSADGTQSLLSKPESIEALQFLVDMILKDKSIPTESQAKQFGTDDQSVFIAGKAAMLTGGVSWTVGFDNAKIDYAIRPLPIGKKAVNTSFVNCWTIPTGAKHPDLSWRVMAFFGGKLGQQIVFDNNLGLPASKSADSATFLAKNPEFHYFLDALTTAEPFPTPLHGVDFFTVVDKYFSLMWIGQMSVKDAVTNIEKTGNDILAGNAP